MTRLPSSPSAYPNDPERELRMRMKIQRIADIEREVANQGFNVLTATGEDAPDPEALLDHVIGVGEAVKEMRKRPWRVHRIG